MSDADPNERVEADPIARDWPVAVIDIGSNSVRLVVYEDRGRAPVPIFNERATCRLGEAVAQSGRLKADNMAAAAAAVKRYVELANRMAVSRLSVIATAAVREAENGSDFAAELERSCNIEVKILSGGREGELSGLGVLSAMPGATGIVGDLGGGSLELVPLGPEGCEPAVTLPLGAISMAGTKLSKAKKFIDKQFDSVDWLKEARFAGGDFHLVGGSWRALARLHMAESDYPLPVLHGYTVDCEDLQKLCRVISRLSPKSVANIRGVSSQRVETLPLAALVLHRLLRLVKPALVRFSAYGLREGVLFTDLSAADQGLDPLLEACRAQGQRNARFEPQGEKLFDWLSPLFPGEDARAARLRLAISTMCDFGWRVHADFRPDYALMETLRSPLVGLNHHERGFLALALRARYTHKNNRGMAAKVSALIGDSAAREAARIGAALRFALTFTGGLPDLLRHAVLARRGDRLVLTVDEAKSSLFGEIVDARFRQMADIFGLAGEVEFRR